MAGCRRSQPERSSSLSLGKPVMISAYKEGCPAMARSSPEGCMIAIIEWSNKRDYVTPYDGGARQLKIGFVHREEFQTEWMGMSRVAPEHVVLGPKLKAQRRNHGNGTGGR